jgi:hypothetical protein
MSRSAWSVSQTCRGVAGMMVFITAGPRARLRRTSSPRARSGPASSRRPPPGCPPARPARHPDLADRVEVGVGGAVQLREDAGQLPGPVGERLAQQPPLRLQVGVVVAELLGRPEQEQRPRLTGLAHRVHGGGPAGGAPADHPALEAAVVGQGVDPEVAAQEVTEAGLVAEDQPAHVGVQPVGADDQVEAPRWAVLEGDLDPVAVLVQGPDRVAEAVVDVVAGGLVEDEVSSPRMISTCRSEIPATSPLTSTWMGLRPGRSTTTSSVWVRAACTLGRTPIHSATSTAGPNRSTACPPSPARRAGFCSTTVGGEAVPVQPPGQGGPGHAGPGHQHLGVPRSHRPPPPCRRPVPGGVAVTLSYRHQT